MSVPSKSKLSEIVVQFEELKNNRDLFAFLLFDDRPSHQPVAQFVEQEFEWFGELANSAQMYIFLFVRQQQGRTRKDGRSSNAKRKIRNPGLEFASKFGIKPSQLPGIIFFTSLSMEGNNTGVYLPIKATIFRDDYSEAEKVFVDLFSIIHECRQNSDSPEQLLSNLRKKVASLKRTRQVRPALMYMRSGLLALVTFSGTLAEVMAKTLVEASVKRVV